MKLPAFAPIAAMSCIAAAAHAQTPQVNGSVVTYSFSWHDNGNLNGNHNGVLEPGEGAAISLAISYSPPSGTPITWNPMIGGSGAGTIRGVQAIFFDLVGTPQAQGTWTNLWMHDSWSINAPSYGTPTMGGSRLNNIQAGQFPPTQPSVNTSNPITDLWGGTWTPASYSPRVESFEVANGSANSIPFPSFVIVRDPALPSIVLVGTSAHDGGSLNIPIVPAPACIPALGCMGLWAARRRTRSPARGSARHRVCMGCSPRR